MSIQTIFSTVSSTAVVLEVDNVEVGKKVYPFIKVKYVDKVSRPDLFNKLSGWIKSSKQVKAGDVVTVRFKMQPDRLGGLYYSPHV